MPTIAIPNYSAVSPATGGARVDAQAAAAPFGALAQAGGQIANVGQMLGQIALERQQHVNQGILANEDTIRRNTFAEIQEYAAQNQGQPEAWDKFAKQKWQEYQNGRTSRAEADGWGPDVKESDELQMKEFSSRANIAFDAERSKALVRQSNARLEANAVTLMSSGDEAGAMKSIGDMNLFEDQRKTVANRVIYQTISGFIASDPVSVLDRLQEQTDAGKPKNWGALDENQRLTLMNEARSAVSKNQRDNYQSLIDGLNSGDVATADQLQGMVNGKLLTATQRNAYLKAYAHGNPTTDPVKIGSLLSDIHNYDPTKDADYSKQGALLARIATGGFPQNVQTQADALMKEKSNPDSVLNSDVAKDAMRYVDQAFNMEVFGKYKRVKLAANGQPALDKENDYKPVIEVDAADFAKASELRSRVQGGLTQFLRDNPKATPEQAQKYVTGFVMGDVQKAGASSLFSAPKPSTINASDDAAAKRDKLNALLKSLNQ